MFFDDPKNALSVARTHQQDLLRAEQRDRLARQGGIGTRQATGILAAALHWLALLFSEGRRFPKGTPASPRSAAGPTPEVVVSGPQS